MALMSAKTMSAQAGWRGALSLGWLWFLLTMLGPSARADEPQFTPMLRIALASNREHYWYPRIVVYEHDGVGQGRVIKVLTSPEKRLDHHPALTGDGKRLVYGREAEGGVGQITAWDLEKDTAADRKSTRLNSSH